MCLHPCLTMCCLFAAVYISYSALAFKADHSREPSVFIDSFFFSYNSFEGTVCELSFLLCLSVLNSAGQTFVSQLKSNHFENVALLYHHSSCSGISAQTSQWQQKATMWAIKAHSNTSKSNQCANSFQSRFPQCWCQIRKWGHQSSHSTDTKVESAGWPHVLSVTHSAALSCPVSFFFCWQWDYSIYDDFRSQWGVNIAKGESSYWPNSLSAWGGNSISHSHSLAQSAGIFSTLLWKSLMEHLWLWKALVGSQVGHYHSKVFVLL